MSGPLSLPLLTSPHLPLTILCPDLENKEIFPTEARQVAGALIVCDKKLLGLRTEVVGREGGEERRQETVWVQLYCGDNTLPLGTASLTVRTASQHNIYCTQSKYKI